MSSTNADDRAGLIDGLLALACFLEAHPDVPVPDSHTAQQISVIPDGTDDEQRAAVDAAAAALGVTAAETRPGSGHYKAVRMFGRVAYEMFAISKAAATRHAAQDSYRDSIRLDDDSAAA
jgi:hypothetical protein